MDSGVQIDGLVEQRQELENLMMSNPAMEKKVQGLIRRVLMAARRAVAHAAQQPSVMKSDPRQAYKAVKSAVWRQVLGGSVSILNKRGTKFGSYEPPRKLRPGQRGGNRRSRSSLTNDRIHYAGDSRAFVLRFLNAGTSGRTTIYGNRGSIRPRNFFAGSSQAAMNKAADELTKLIDELIKNAMKHFNITED